ncbi:hypothetical protein EVAR_93862_1 [Eumeta japonica]|uniref:Uncharacterized protein n=1 Tax=Eumeta variegata TaxID=151549 RepID=A0A4C1TWR5_EUMVA|nr:hypothetical protein EVAR_93862_1 [Eumeta japonica]
MKGFMDISGARKIYNDRAQHEEVVFEEYTIAKATRKWSLPPSKLLTPVVSPGDARFLVRNRISNEKGGRLDLLPEARSVWYELLCVKNSFDNAPAVRIESITTRFEGSVNKHELLRFTLPEQFADQNVIQNKTITLSGDGRVVERIAFVPEDKDDTLFNTVSSGFPIRLGHPSVSHIRHIKAETSSSASLARSVFKSSTSNQSVTMKYFSVTFVLVLLVVVVANVSAAPTPGWGFLKDITEEKNTEERKDTQENKTDCSKIHGYNFRNEQCAGSGQRHQRGARRRRPAGAKALG